MHPGDPHDAAGAHVGRPPSGATDANPLQGQGDVVRIVYLAVIALMLLGFGCVKERQPEGKEVVQPAPPGTIRASHILISYAGAPRTAATRTKEEAKQLAQEVLAKARGGEDFEDLARRYSDCPSAQNERSGDLGFFGKGKMVKPFEDAAFALKVGEISGIVETDFGYHIIKRTQ
jgi:parvulin-like peptidyl-prolyl isomerase